MCPTPKVLDEVTQRCVYLEDCKRPGVLLLLQTPSCLQGSLRNSAQGPTFWSSWLPAGPWKERSSLIWVFFFWSPFQRKVTWAVEVLLGVWFWTESILLFSVDRGLGCLPSEAVFDPSVRVPVLQPLTSALPFKDS